MGNTAYAVRRALDLTMTAAITITADELPRFMLCNPSRVMAASYPAVETDTTIRDEGIAADWFAEQWFNGALDASYNGKAPNGVFITAEMVQFVEQYLRELDPGEMQCVTSFSGPTWHVGARADHVSLNTHPQNPSDSVLTIDDLKYGYRAVEPEMNWTLIAHAIGYCITRNVAPSVIVLRIHQPRLPHPDGRLRSWSITYTELKALYERLAARLAQPSEMLNAGLPQCARCPAAATCPANQRAGFNSIDATELAFDNNISNVDLAYELDVLTYAQSIIDNRLEALLELGKHRVSNGAVVPNYAMETKLANTRFKSAFNDPEMLRVLTGVDMTKPSIVTPAEAKRRGMQEAVYDAITERPVTGAKLIRVDPDKRARRALGNK